MKFKHKALIAFGMLILAAIYYYITLPAINIHSADFWNFIIIVFAFVPVVYIIKKRMTLSEIRESKGIKVQLGIVVALVLVFIIGAILSSPIINASKYQALLTVEDGEFTEDIEELSYDQIPILDKASAELLGDRQLGSMSDIVSQFEVDDIYTQINYQEKPVRVSPLEYASAFKWFTNQSDGIPGYIMVDMTTEDTELVRLDEGIKYSESEYFNRNIYRHLRFNYPTYIFDDLSFEIDDDGVPYYVAPVKQFNIGLFGGVTIGKVVICNAITGETTSYDVDEVPEWVDSVYSAELLTQLYDYYGTLKNGYINSILGQKDAIQTTSGANYLAIDNDVWVYTGVTSVTSDQSNIGFVLMNQRTMETKFYSVEGATEVSAMSSAEGMVQDLGYDSTFPLLLNISGEPTYFVALKDDAGLVKMYAMINVEKYQLVATGDTVSACESAYNTMLLNNGVTEEATDDREELTITGTIEDIAELVIEGNSHYYLILSNSNDIFDIVVEDYVDIIRYDIGDNITLEYKSSEIIHTVIGIQ
ncbi:MAG: CvpA family protein [Eubacteriales bacterium]